MGREIVWQSHIPTVVVESLKGAKGWLVEGSERMTELDGVLLLKFTFYD